MYDIRDGRILTWSLEYHLVDHCNLRCEHCCTLSPVRPERFVRPDRLEQDLRWARTALAPNVFKLTGGEPLLHPELRACVEIAKDSGIAEQISLTTNGHLIRKMPEEAWELLDRLTVSDYSSAPLAPQTRQWVEEMCLLHDVSLTVKDVHRFGQLTPNPWPLEEPQTREVFDACWLRTRCHSIYDGVFYACTRPPHVHGAFLGGGDPSVDGVPLGAHRLTPQILDYLQRSSPLESCAVCLGGRGPWHEHRQDA